jgi:hypothetical protein
VTVTEHDLLLRATLAPEPEASDAYARWRAQADLATLDRASQRVLSLLAERLDGQDDEVAAKVRRIARFTWLRTQVLLEHTAPAVRALAESGVPVMLIKGAAVLAHTDWKVARRPMDDLDVAVPRARAGEAVAVLRGLGFQSALAGDPRQFDERHALPFRDPSGAELDLHWHVLHSSLHHDSDTAFWEAAEDAEVRGVACRVLCREDALLQACTQGREYSEAHPLRWAADAAELLRGAESFDWGRVVEQARRHRLGWELRAAARVLAEVTGEPVPPEVTGGRLRVAGRARRLEESGGDGPLAPTRAERVQDEWLSWVRREVAPGVPLRPGHAALYLKDAWALPRVRQIPLRREVEDPTPPGAVALRRGDTLGFRHGEAGVANLGAGWWAPDEHGTWSRGREAVLVLPLAARDDGPFMVTIDLVPFLTPTRPHMEVRVAGQRWGFSGTTLADTRRVVRVPAQPGRARIALRLQIRHPLSPLAARYDADPRPLGVALLGLALS